MIYIFHGQNQSASRDYLLKLKKKYDDFLSLSGKGVIDKLKEESSNLTLISKRILYVVEGLENLDLLEIKLPKEVDVAIWFPKKINPPVLKSGQEVKILEFNLLGKIDSFKFTDSFARKDLNKTLFFLEKLLSLGEAPEVLIGALSFQIKNLLVAKEGGLKLLKLHPFVEKKSQEFAKSWEAKQLVNFLKKLLNLDFSIKQGKIEPKLSLTLFVVESLQ